MLEEVETVENVDNTEEVHVLALGKHHLPLPVSASAKRESIYKSCTSGPRICNGCRV